MPLLPEQPINVKSLIIEAPIEQPKLRFDVKKEVSNEDWQAMIKERNDCREYPDWYAFTLLTAALHQIDPTKDLELMEEDWQAMIDERKFYKGSQLPFFTYLTAYLHQINPTKDLELTEQDWQAMINNRNDRRDSNPPEWYIFTRLTASLHQINPTKDLELTEQDWQAMIDKRNDYRNNPTRRGDFTHLTKSLHIIASDITYHPKKGMILKPPKQKVQGRAIPPLPII